MDLSKAFDTVDHEILIKASSLWSKRLDPGIPRYEWH